MSNDDNTYEMWLKQATFTDVTDDVNEKFRRIQRRENARKKDRRRNRQQFERVLIPANTRHPKHRLTITQED
jgi:hypothetical protein